MENRLSRRGSEKAVAADVRTAAVQRPVLAPRGVIETLSLALYLMSFVIVFLTDGGVYPLPLSFAVVLMALATIGAGYRQGVHARTAGVFLAALGLWLVISTWVVIQTLALPGGWGANAAWQTLAQAGVAASPSIAVVPGDAIHALLPLSLSFMAFLSALLLFRTDRQAERALQVFAACGAALALFAIIQSVFFPDVLMFAPKQSYVGSLTAPFVNRNTAATFYGLVLVAVITGYARTREKDGRRPTRGLRAAWAGTWGHASMLAVVLVALALTQSRAGATATLLACLLLVPALIIHHLARNREKRMGRRRMAWLSGQRFAVAVLAAVILVSLAALLFGRSVVRAERQGLDDSRLCVTRSILPAIGDNWAAGLGPASFRFVFPAYRSPDCGLQGTWVRAHDVFLEATWSLGLPVSLAAFLAAGLVLFRTFRIGLRMRRSRRPLVWGAISACLLVGVHSIVDFSLQIPGLAMSFACLLAVAVTVSLNRSST